MKRTPVIINQTDKQQVEMIKKSQMAPLNENSKVEFETDERNTYYEIYRTRKRPKSYEDFSENPVKLAYNPGFEETLKPNTIYYYTLENTT